MVDYRMSALSINFFYIISRNEILQLTGKNSTKYFGVCYSFLTLLKSQISTKWKSTSRFVLALLLTLVPLIEILIMMMMLMMMLMMMISSLAIIFLFLEFCSMRCTSFCNLYVELIIL